MRNLLFLSAFCFFSLFSNRNLAQDFDSEDPGFYSEPQYSQDYQDSQDNLDFQDYSEVETEDYLENPESNGLAYDENTGALSSQSEVALYERPQDEEGDFTQYGDVQYSENQFSDDQYPYGEGNITAPPIPNPYPEDESSFEDSFNTSDRSLIPDIQVQDYQD